MIKKISFLLIGLLFSASAFGACNPIMPMAGGLGACNDNSYIVNLGGAVNTQGSVTFSGLYPFTANLSAATSITFPTAGTLLSDAGSYSNPSWLTALDASKLTSGILPSLRLEGDYGGITGVGTLGNLTISNTGIVQGAISTSTTGSTNSATWLASRGDQANGEALTIYQTAGITNYAEGIFTNTNHYKIWDAVNNVYPIDITPGAGTSSIMQIAGNLEVPGTELLGASQTLASTGNKLNIIGTDSSTDGSMRFYTAGAGTRYPLISILPFTQGNESIAFDAYFDSGAWKSSSSGSNYQINKNLNKFEINYKSGIAAGSNITWSNAISIDTSGGVTISTGDLILNTAGKTLKIKQGTNACSGSVTLSGATTAVNTTCAATGDQIFFSGRTTMGSTPGFLSYTISNSVSFTITSSTGASDNGVLNWFILKAS